MHLGRPLKECKQVGFFVCASSNAGFLLTADANAAAARTAVRDPLAGDKLLESTLAFVAKCQASPAAALVQPVPDDLAPAQEVLREIEAAVACLGSDTRGGAARHRAFLQLVRLLQLHLLAKPGGFDASVALDLQRVAAQGLNAAIELPEVEEEEGGEGEAAAGADEVTTMIP